MIAVANCPVFICPNSKRSPFHIIPCHRVPGLYSEQYHCPALWWGRGGLGPGVKTEFYRMCSTALWPLCCNYLYIKPGGMFGQIDQLPDQLNYILTIKTSIKHLLQFYCHCYLLLIDWSSSQCTHCIYSIFTILSPRPMTSWWTEYFPTKCCPGFSLNNHKTLSCAILLLTVCYMRLDWTDWEGWDWLERLAFLG